MLFSFGVNDEQNNPEVESKPALPGRRLELANERGQSVMGVPVATVAGVLFKRALPDINFEIAKQDDLKNKDELAEALAKSSDLIEGVYEGGCKTWECSLDLVTHMHTTRQEYKGKTILELGCGSALPGILAINLGAASVDFQDYNEQVLRFVTIPNICLNTLELPIHVDTDGYFSVELNHPSSALHSKFFVGDWKTLENVIESKYDVILSSETIYNLGAIPSLLQIIKFRLKPQGHALVAAKHTYFGCSGSLNSFKEIATSQFGFKIEQVFSNTSGIRREILKLSL